MSSYPDDRFYSKSHEWVRVEGDIATIGITDHAQKELGDVVFVELPDVGEIFDEGQEFGTIESGKACRRADDRDRQRGVRRGRGQGLTSARTRSA